MLFTKYDRHKAKAVSIFVLLLLSAGTFAQSVSITKHKPQKKTPYTYSFVHISDLHIGESITDYGTEGYFDEPPAGDMGYSAERLRKAVNWINAHKDSLRIKFVIITGDLTDSGERSEFMKAKELLDELKIPYVPLIGNHDVHPYTVAEENATPTGDSLINVVFKETFEKLQKTFPAWDNGTRLNRVWNPVSKNFNYLQNYSFTYEKQTFLLSDWDTRTPTANESRGISSLGETHDFEGGTLPWLKTQLTKAGDNKNTFIFAHHPLNKIIVRNKYCFPDKTYKKIAETLLPYKNKFAYWFAGHFHRDNRVAITSKCKKVGSCIETGANKKHKNGHFRIVQVWNMPE